MSTRRISDYVCAYCHGELVAHPGGNWSCDYHGFGVNRRSKRWLAKQRAIAAEAANAPVPVAAPKLTKEQARTALYGGYED